MGEIIIFSILSFALGCCVVGHLKSKPKIITLPLKVSGSWENQDIDDRIMYVMRFGEQCPEGSWAKGFALQTLCALGRKAKAVENQEKN